MATGSTVKLKISILWPISSEYLNLNFQSLKRLKVSCTTQENIFYPCSKGRDSPPMQT